MGCQELTPWIIFAKQHDNIYSQYGNTETRTSADNDLAQAAWNRATAKDATLGERLAALNVAGIMTGKQK